MLVLDRLLLMEVLEEPLLRITPVRDLGPIRPVALVAVVEQATLRLELEVDTLVVVVPMGVSLVPVAVADRTMMEATKSILPAQTVEMAAW